MRLLTLSASFLFVMAGSALAKECRMPDLPSGAQVHLPPECKGVVRTKQGSENVKADGGFVDIGNGTKVRVGGRVRAEMGISR